MYKQLIKITLVIILVIAGVGLSMLALSRLVTAHYASPRLFNSASAPNELVAIVFGAGLRRDGSPTPVLRDRIETAAELYFSGKVEKLLMSGSSDFRSHNEPKAMQAYAISLGVPAQDILLDESGRRTYDTCYRAREIYQIQRAILVTQGFHLPRALYICNAIGMQAIGVPADQRAYRQRSMVFWNLRESFATLVALWEVHVVPPAPATGNFPPVSPREAG